MHRLKQGLVVAKKLAIDDFWLVENGGRLQWWM